MKNKFRSALALDPFEGGRSNLGGFSKFAKRFDFDILPLSVFADGENSFVGGDAIREQKIESKIREKLRKFGKFLAPSAVLLKSGSRNLAVNAFLQKAKDQNVELIAVESHGRSGLRRWTLGSFAENLLNHSPKPLLFLPKSWPTTPSKKREILFPTDFGERSLEAFQSLLNLFSGRGVNIVLYHAILFPAPISSVEIPVSAYIPDAFFKDQRKWAELQANKWKKLAEENGFSVKFVLEEKGMGFLSGATIMEMAKKLKVDFIGISSSSGALDRFFSGSSAFELFRQKKLPVLVFGPNCKRN
jgi:nucleotide-binding universal stress UspA family protein